VNRRLLAVLTAMAAVMLFVPGGSASAATRGASAAPRAHRIGGIVPDIPTRGHVARRYAPRTANLSYGGGPVLHSNRSHVIFWQPAGSGLSFEPGYAALVERFLAQVAADSHMPGNVYGLSGQYRDAFGPAAYNSAYEGWVTDSAPLPPNGCQEPSTGPGWSYCVTDAQLEQQLEEVVTADHLPRRANDIYFIVTPNGLGNCIDASSTSCALGGSNSGYCGYHSQTLSGLLYAVIPYNAVPGHCQSDNPRPNNSTADPTVSTISHEHNETVTDPEADAWIDQDGQENGDLCIQNFGPNIGGSGQSAWNEVVHGGHYYLQEEWSNEDHGCAAREKPDRVSFSGATRTQAGRWLPFTPKATAAHGWIVAYDWFFGDGRSGHGRRVKHLYRRPGAYRVVLRTTDSAGNWAFSSRTVRVSRAPTHSRRRR
jgi:hypothetical protein